MAKYKEIAVLLSAEELLLLRHRLNQTAAELTGIPDTSHSRTSLGAIDGALDAKLYRAQTELEALDDYNA